jgi:hypothetical protein
MLEEMKDRHEKDNETIHTRVSALQKKVDVNAKFVIGAGAVLATLVAVLQVVPPILKVLTPQSSAVSMTGMVMDLSEFS